MRLQQLPVSGGDNRASVPNCNGGVMKEMFLRSKRVAPQITLKAIAASAGACGHKCSQTLGAGAKRSREKRVRATIPPGQDRGTDFIQHSSASGAFIRTDLNYTPGSEISFTIELDTPAGKMTFKCRGQIVQVENREGKVGVEAKFTESQQET